MGWSFLVDRDGETFLTNQDGKFIIVYCVGMLCTAVAGASLEVFL